MESTFLSNVISVQLRYRGNLLFYIFVVFLSYFIKLAYIGAVFQFTATVGGYTAEEVIFVIYLSAISALTANIFVVSIYNFFRALTQGKVVPFLVQPRPILITLLCRWARVENTAIILFLLPFWPYLDPGFEGRTALHWIVGLVGLVVGVVSIIVFVSGLSLLTFAIRREIPVDFINSEVQRLNMLPVGVYPTEIRHWAIALMPSIFSAAVPASALLKGQYVPSLVFLVATLASGVIVWHVLTRTLVRFDHMGG